MESLDERVQSVEKELQQLRTENEALKGEIVQLVKKNTELHAKCGSLYCSQVPKNWERHYPAGIKHMHEHELEKAEAELQRAYNLCKGFFGVKSKYKDARGKASLALSELKFRKNEQSKSLDYAKEAAKFLGEDTLHVAYALGRAYELSGNQRRALYYTHFITRISKAYEAQDIYLKLLQILSVKFE